MSLRDASLRELMLQTDRNKAGWHRTSSLWSHYGGWWWAVLLTMGMTLAGCPKPPQDPVENPSNQPGATSNGASTSREIAIGNALIGQELYERKCQRCHGTDALPVDQALMVIARDDPGGALTIIREGRSEMPAYGNRIPTQLLEDVVMYLQVAGIDGAVTVMP